MQSIWDLLPASLLPTQPFISSDQQTRIMQALWALQAPANAFSPVAGGSGNLAGPSSSQAPEPAPSLSGGDHASAPGGILGAAFGASAPGGILGPVFGANAAAPTATGFQALNPPQGPSLVSVASTADQLPPRPPPAVVPGAPSLMHAPRPVGSMHSGPGTGAQPYFPPQNFVQHMISGTPEPGPLWNDATRKSLVDYAASRGIAGAMAGEMTKEPPAGAHIAPWSAAHGLLDIPVIAPIAGLTEAAIRSASQPPLTDEDVRQRQEWARRYYIPRPGEKSPPNPANPNAGNPLDLVLGPLNAFHEAWDPPLHPPPNSTFDDGGTIYVDDANGESRPWSEVDPRAARAYYEQERRRADFAPSFALSLLGGGANFAERGAVGVAGSRLGGGTRRLPKRGASPGETTAPLAQADTTASPTLARAALTGQNHHAISKRVCTALDKVPGLAGIYEYRDPRLVTRAIDRDAHKGYQTWHRDLDSEIAAYVENNPHMIPNAFERYLRNRYDQPDLLARFPNGL